MKLVFMGTPEFAAVSLERLIEDGYDIELVITQPDRRGDRNKMMISPVKETAARYGIDVAQPQRLRKDEELIARLEEMAPDMIIVAAFGQILPKRVLDIPQLGCINVHGSLLPELRGASPIHGAILQGADISGISIMRMDEGIDTGDVISRRACGIKGLNITEASGRLAILGAELLSDTLPDIISGEAEYEKQDDSLASYAGIIRKEDGYTDFSESAAAVECKIRAYCEWPSCYSSFKGLQVKFYSAEALMDEVPDGEPGTVSRTDKSSYVINCGEGKLRILEQQLQGRKRMSAGDFMRGHRLEAGDRFGTVKESR